MFIAFLSCGSDNEDRKVYTSKSVDISGLMIYAGSENGPKEVIFDNFRNNTLMTKYFTSRNYQPGLYGNITIEFYGDKLYYDSGSYRMVSDYVFEKDTLFIIKSDGTKLFVALGNSPDNLYLHQAVYYYLTNSITSDPENPSKREENRESTDVLLNIDSVLKYAGFENKLMTNPKDTIAWCNIIYPLR